MKRLIFLFALLLSLGMYAQEARDAFLDMNEPKKEKKEYKFSATWRIQAGYVQDWQNSPAETYPNLYLHGGSVGATVDFNLPYNLSVQTGVVYALTYGKSEQHWRSVNNETVQIEYLEHNVLKHALNIPIHLNYRQPLWKELALVFYGGPTMQIGVWQQDNIKQNLSDANLAWLQANNIHTEPYNKYKSELLPFNFLVSLGGGLEWGPYRLQAGYDFGLINLVRNYPVEGNPNNAYMREWSWNVVFAYRF